MKRRPPRVRALYHSLDHAVGRRSDFSPALSGMEYSAGRVRFLGSRRGQSLRPAAHFSVIGSTPGGRPCGPNMPSYQF